MAELPTGTVTFLFTDIEGSTRLLQALGEQYRTVLEDHCRLLRQALADGGGMELSTEGDAFFAVFPGAPQAIAAAVAAQRALAGHGWPEQASVKVRMGLHTGEGILGGENYLGLDVHRAARIAAAGHGGQVLVSDATRALVWQSLPEGIRLQDLGEHRLKDLAEPEHLFQVSAPDLPDDFPTLRSLDARPTNLPLQMTSFIGREQAVESVKSLLSMTRLLNLTGPGGTGKTRLALQVAALVLDDFSDGVFVVALAPISDPELVPSTIAQAVGVQEVPGRSIVESLEEYLAGRELLLVLDNFEQVLPAAHRVTELLGAAPRLKTLITSRARLHVSGEQEFPVPPLDLPDLRHLPPWEALSQYDAVALFIQRARAGDPDFEVTNQNAPAVAEITSRLDGLPLAIELAAARVRLLGADGILARLEHRLALLRSGAQDVPARQQTLRDTIAWSYDLLDDEDQALFRRLGVFMGGFTIEAAEAVGEAELEGLGSLLDKSLLRQVDGRLQMLETIREFALELLGDDHEAPRRHADYYSALAIEAESHLEGREQLTWLNQLSDEHDNLRAVLRWAIDHGEAELALTLAGSLWRFWHFRGHLTEGRQWLMEILELPAAAQPSAARAKGLSGLAGLVYWQGDYPGAARLYQEALAIYRRLGDRPGEAYTLYSLSSCASMGGDPAAAVPLAEQSLAIYRELGDQRGLVNLLGSLGFYLAYAGDPVSGLPFLEEAMALSRSIGDRFLVGNGLMGLGAVLLMAGDHQASFPFFLETMELASEMQDMSGISMALYGLALVAVVTDPERAVRLAEAADSLQEEAGVKAHPSSMGMEDPREVARKLLSEEQVAKARAEGRAMSLEEALADARKGRS